MTLPGSVGKSSGVFCCPLSRTESDHRPIRQVAVGLIPPDAPTNSKMGNASHSYRVHELEQHDTVPRYELRTSRRRCHSRSRPTLRLIRRSHFVTTVQNHNQLGNTDIDTVPDRAIQYDDQTHERRSRGLIAESGGGSDRSRDGSLYPNHI